MSFGIKTSICRLARRCKNGLDLCLVLALSDFKSVLEAVFKNGSFQREYVYAHIRHVQQCIAFDNFAQIPHIRTCAWSTWGQNPAFIEDWWFEVHFNLVHVQYEMLLYINLRAVRNIL